MRLSRHTNDPFARLLDTLHYDSKLYLVFEFLDNDLKRYQEAMNAAHTPLNTQLIKVREPDDAPNGFLTPFCQSFRNLRGSCVLVWFSATLIVLSTVT